MNEEKESLWLLIHAKITHALAFNTETKLSQAEMELLREQMPKLLK